MSKRSGEIIAYVLGVIAIASLPVYFHYHQFHWWLLIGPALGSIFVVMQQRRQNRADSD
jgi:hypothetical protein